MVAAPMAQFTADDVPPTVFRRRSATPLQWVRETWAYLQKHEAITQEDVATKFNFSLTTTSNWERGLFRPRKAQRAKLAEYYGAPLSLFDDAVEMTYWIWQVRRRDLKPDQRARIERELLSEARMRQWAHIKSTKGDFAAYEAALAAQAGELYKAFRALGR